MISYPKDGAKDQESTHRAFTSTQEKLIIGSLGFKVAQAAVMLGSQLLKDSERVGLFNQSS